MSCLYAAMSWSADVAVPLPMSLMPSMTITVWTSGWLSTSRSNLACTLTPALSTSTRLPEMPSFMIPNRWTVGRVARRSAT